MSKSRKPNYRLKTFDTKSEKNGRIGAGWLNDNGSISIVLDPAVVLGIQPNVAITLWPIEEGQREPDSTDSSPNTF